MSWGEFWDGKPEIAAHYRKKHQMDTETQNFWAWWQGRYVYEAFSVVEYNLNRKKGKQTQDYPQGPHRITPLTEEELAAKEAEDRRALVKSLDARARQFMQAQERR
jgi:hypothetical protein